jgi:hypothetical protein
VSKSKYPVVKAYAPGPALLKKYPSLKPSWIVPCPFCERIHVHGASEGRREEHCPRGGPAWLYDFKRPYGYTLKLAGEIDDKNLFRDEARRLKAEGRKKWSAYIKVFADRHKERCRQSREAFNAMRKRSAAATG